MIKKNIFIGVFILYSILGFAQENTYPKVILITMDGFRWQELFSGADTKLVANKDYVKDTSELKAFFWRDSAKERREVLMPFVWQVIAKNGQIHGNRNLESKINLTNNHRFSYPGYNEILSGKADDKRINSNDKTPNPNKTILEIVNTEKRYNSKVAAFGSWDVFPYIINESRSKVPVNAGFELAKGSDLTDKEKFLNKLQQETPSPWGIVRLDVFTHNFALEYMKRAHPKLVYIAYGETDDFAHDGNYQAYLKSANTTDGFIEEIWNFIENDDFYKGQTTLIISTDHGRGTEPLDTWRSHGAKISGSDQVWLMAIGKGIAPKGEIVTNEQLYSNQIAASIAKLLGVKVVDLEIGRAFGLVEE
jgi:Metalloenzyme superfamily